MTLITIGGERIFSTYPPYVPMTKAGGNSSTITIDENGEASTGDKPKCFKTVTFCENNQSGASSNCCGDVASITISWNSLSVTWNGGSWGADSSGSNEFYRLSSSDGISCTFQRPSDYGTQTITMVGVLQSRDVYGVADPVSCVDGDLRFGFFASVQSTASFSSNWCFHQVKHYQYANGGLTLGPMGSNISSCDMGSCNGFEDNFPNGPTVSVSYVAGSPCESSSPCVPVTTVEEVAAIEIPPEVVTAGLFAGTLAKKIADGASPQEKLIFLEHYVRTGNHGDPSTLMDMIEVGVDGQPIFDADGTFKSNLMSEEAFLKKFPSKSAKAYEKHLNFFETMRDKLNNNNEQALIKEMMEKIRRGKTKNIEYTFCKGLVPKGGSGGAKMGAKLTKLGKWGILMAILYGSFDGEVNAADAFLDLFNLGPTTMGDGEIDFGCAPTYVCPSDGDGSDGSHGGGGGPGGPTGCTPYRPGYLRDLKAKRPRPQAPSNMLNQHSFNRNNNILAINDGKVSSDNKFHALSPRQL